MGTEDPFSPSVGDVEEMAERGALGDNTVVSDGKIQEASVNERNQPDGRFQPKQGVSGYDEGFEQAVQGADQTKREKTRSRGRGLRSFKRAEKENKG